MGYTHYIKYDKGFTSENWSKFIKEAKGVFERAKKAGIEFTGDFCGETIIPVDFSGDELVFNGVGDDSHETCAISKKGDEFEFCKTARKPYDAIVVAIYVLARKYGENVVISSDGGEDVFKGCKLS